MNQLNKWKVDELIEAINIPKPVYLLSDVFVIPDNKSSQKYHNFYSKSTINRGKKYYLRSFGGNFCQTPISLFKTVDQASVYSIGPGLYGEKEETVILIESFTKASSNVFDVKQIVKELKSPSFVRNYEINVVDRWDNRWLNISIVVK